jgi:hypothetical protein
LVLSHGGRFLGYQAGVAVFVDALWVIVFASYFLAVRRPPTVGLRVGSTVGTVWQAGELEIGVAHSAARGTILAGGIALVGGALAFVGVFSYLAARLHYPEVLEGSAQDVLPALLATGTSGRVAWALYGVLALVFVLGGVGAFEALRECASGPMRAGLVSAAPAVP